MPKDNETINTVNEYFEESVNVRDPITQKCLNYSTDILINPAGYAVILIKNKRESMKNHLEVLASSCYFSRIPWDISCCGAFMWNLCCCGLPACLVCMMDLLVCFDYILDCGKKNHELQEELIITEDEEVALLELLDSLVRLFPEKALSKGEMRGSPYFPAFFPSDIVTAKEQAKNTVAAIENFIALNSSWKFISFLKIIKFKITAVHHLTSDVAKDNSIAPPLISEESDSELTSESDSSEKPKLSIEEDDEFQWELCRLS